MKFLSLLTTIFLISNTAPALAEKNCDTQSTAQQTFTICGGNVGSSYIPGQTVTLTATVSGYGVLTEVNFYNKATGALLCSATNPQTSTTAGVTTYSFICPWVISHGPQTSPVSIDAIAIGAGGNGSASGVNKQVIDMVGSPALSWREGDDQMCSATWPYNESSPTYPDGYCQFDSTPTAKPPVPPPSPLPASSTLDGLDDTMHILSDFVNYSDLFLSTNVDKLSSGFDSWYSQAAAWIAPKCVSTKGIDPSNGRSQCDYYRNANCNIKDNSCHPGSDGRLLSIYEPNGYPNIPGSPSNYMGTAVDKLKDWNTLITNWLNNKYANDNAWCVPPESTPETPQPALSSTAEDTYIKANSPTGQWGDLPHVISCLNYNAAPYSAGAGNSAIYAYQQCLIDLTKSSRCPSSLPSKCNPSILGRSLATSDFINGNPPAFSKNVANCATTAYAKYVSDSLTLAQDEASKFALRAAFLNDIYTRAKTMQSIFTSGDAALKQFFKPCSGVGCSQGGPAAQLIYARTHGTPAASFPNAVIYGWVDNPPSGGSGGCMSTGSDGKPVRGGCSHLVKVTAYSPGRGGNWGNAQSDLPKVDDVSDFFTIAFRLDFPDGLVYVKVRRWDEDHSNPVLFPNKHTLWQFLFHKPGGDTRTGTALISACKGLTLPSCSGANCNIGFGLVSQTLTGLGAAKIPSQDQVALSNAFMLNDEQDGAAGIDPSAKSNSIQYNQCLSEANKLLDTAPESHACAKYVAAKNGDDPSRDNDNDYSLKFVNCPPGDPDDLTYESASNLGP